METPRARAPINGLKMLLLILLVFAVGAAYAQWQRAHRGETISAKILPPPNESVSPAPNEP